MLTKEEIEIMDGMEESNNEMVDRMEAQLSNEQPICHFTKMDFDEGMWVCKHCGHETESSLAYMYGEEVYY